LYHFLFLSCVFEKCLTFLFRWKIRHGQFGLVFLASESQFVKSSKN
jgi:hypothetical protein